MMQLRGYDIRPDWGAMKGLLFILVIPYASAAFGKFFSGSYSEIAYTNVVEMWTAGAGNIVIGALVLAVVGIIGAIVVHTLFDIEEVEDVE